MKPRRRTGVVRYGLAVAAVVLSFALTKVPLVAAVPAAPAVFLLLAVLFSATTGGRGAGLLATALIVLVAVGPHPRTGHLITVGIFAAVGSVISHLVGALDEARR